MTTHSFPAGEKPRVILEHAAGGDLQIVAWDERQIGVETDEDQLRWSQTDEALVLNISGDAELRLPRDAELVADHVHGDATISGIAGLSLGQVHGDAEVRSLDGDVRIVQVHGDLSVEDSRAVVVETYVHGDATLRRVGLIRLRVVQGDLTVEDAGSLLVEEKVNGDTNARRTGSLEIRRVDGGLDVADASALIVGDVGGDLEVRRIREVVRYGSVGGDVEVRESEGAHMAGGSAGGDCTAIGVSSLQAGDVGGDIEVRNVSGDVRVGSVGGDADVTEVAGVVAFGNVGGDLELRASGLPQIGNVGGSLKLAASFPPDSVTRITIGGDAEIALPSEPNLTLRATVGGEVSGGRVVAAGGGGFSAVYGEGSARLELVVGGDLRLGGAGEPRSASSNWGGVGWFGKDMERWGEEFGEQFGRDMERWGEEFGKDMERWGEEFGRRMEERFSSWGDEGKAEKWAEKSQRRAERMRERAEEHMRRTVERAERHAERGPRVQVRINDRQWSFDPERIERMKEQARRAAGEGVSGALEAVERAFEGMGFPTPPAPPHAPAPPNAPSSPNAPAPPQASPPPATGATIKMSSADVTLPAEQAESERRSTPDERRAAILRMVAEGRLSPEEGDLLLEALG